MFRLLRNTTTPEDDGTPTPEEVARVTEMLARTRPGGAYERVLAQRVGQLHARSGSTVYDALTAVDLALAATGRPVASAGLTCDVVRAWANDVRALHPGAESLTGLSSAEDLHAHMEHGDCGGRHVLIAELMIDERDQRARGPLRSVEAELSLALLHDVLGRGIDARSPWARLGERRLGAAVDVRPGTADVVGEAVHQARRWLERWRHDLDVAAWIEPVPVEPRARGLLMRDLAM